MPWDRIPSERRTQACFCKSLHALKSTFYQASITYSGATAFAPAPIRVRMRLRATGVIPKWRAMSA